MSVLRTHPPAWGSRPIVRTAEGHWSDCRVSVRGEERVSFSLWILWTSMRCFLGNRWGCRRSQLLEPAGFLRCPGALAGCVTMSLACPVAGSLPTRAFHWAESIPLGGRAGGSSFPIRPRTPNSFPLESGFYEGLMGGGEGGSFGSLFPASSFFLGPVAGLPPPRGPKWFVQKAPALHPSLSLSSPGPGRAMNRPKSLVCYLCGQGFGTASLAIHQPQCHRKKLAQWEVGDPRTRGPKPVDPAPRDTSRGR